MGNWLIGPLGAGQGQKAALDKVGPHPLIGKPFTTSLLREAQLAPSPPSVDGTDEVSPI